MNQLASGHPLVRQGTLIDGRYQVIRTIGEGGAGLVFEAKQLSVGRSVALKILRLDRWSEVATKRFAREAQALGRVQSDRVLRVLEQGNDADVGPYLVTELARGEMLCERLTREKSVDVSSFMVLGRSLLAALEDVHAAGLLHRDLKPSNIALPKHGPIAVKLLDFGLATGLEPQSFSRLTKTDDVVGSLPYIAPELFDGEPASVQSDLWSLGVVFYEMLGGRRPFAGESSASLMKSILAHEVDWRALPETLPVETLRLLQQLLSRDPADRPASCAEALAAFAIEPHAKAAVSSAIPPARPWAFAFAGAAVGALTVSACWLMFALEEPDSTDAETAQSQDILLEEHPSSALREPTERAPDQGAAPRTKTHDLPAAGGLGPAPNNPVAKPSTVQKSAAPPDGTRSTTRRPIDRAERREKGETVDDSTEHRTWQGGVIEDYP